MMTKVTATVLLMQLLLAIGVTAVEANPGKAQAQDPLSETGQRLEAEYAHMLAALKAEIVASLPTFNEQNVTAYQQALAVEKAAVTRENEAQAALDKNRGTVPFLNHRKAWIGRAEKGVAEAKQKLQQAEAMTGDAQAKADALAEAREELAKIEENHRQATEALKLAQEAADKAKVEEPALASELQAATQARVETQAKTMKAVEALALDTFLSSDKLDARLAKYVVLLDATPRGLAAFAQQGQTQQAMIARMLADDDLLVQMVVADGSNEGRYGRAMEIYNAIQSASDKARTGSLQRLALAISLEHAVPVAQQNAKAMTDAPATVDPVNRYRHYEQAFLNGELDPNFKNLSVWDYRMVVYGEEPDETLAWGREMLRNYRPDHITTSDQRWRYVAAVRTDVVYGSQDVKYDQDELQFFQNILMNGGICGRRAFFGRFILRAFGVPTTARPQPGHAALARWTPDGWVVCLGAGWGSGWTKTRYGKDLDFLANTQARAVGEPYMMVKRAQWIGDVMGEARAFSFAPRDPGFWYGVSLYTQRRIIEDAKVTALAAIGEDIGEANESKEKDVIVEVAMTDADRAISVDDKGVMTIPAAATSTPTRSTGKILFMASNLGGKQLHYSRNGRHEDFEYTFEAPTAGRYTLAARVVTPSWKQVLELTVNQAENPIEIALPFTVGMWDVTQPVEVELVQGRNVLKFSGAKLTKGVTIRDFTLTPIAGRMSRVPAAQ
jgi:hypothetical protein